MAPGCSASTPACGLKRTHYRKWKSNRIIKRTDFLRTIKHSSKMQFNRKAVFFEERLYLIASRMPPGQVSTTNVVIRLSVHSFIGSLVHAYIHSFIETFFHSSIDSFIILFVCSFVHTFMPSFIHSSFHALIRNIPSFLPSCFHLSIRLFILSFI